MIVKTNKRNACGLNYLFKLVVFCFLSLSYSAYSQDTVSLKSVEIYTEKTNFSGLGKKTETIDSTLKSQFKFNSIADVLSANSAVFIKSYGSGGIASTAFRGGNASQTALLWNGFNIQNPMLGQADIALLPAIIFDDVAIEYGGSSALWGSGAVGGSIQLKNNLQFNKGLNTSTHFGFGSIGSKNVSTAICFSRKNISSQTKLYLNDSKNNFNYKSASDSLIKQAKYANYNFKGLSQEFKFLIGSNQSVGFNAWLNANLRHLPDFNLESNSKTYQNDEAVRLTADWNYFKKRINTGIKAAYFNDKIDYTDSLALLFSKTKAQTFIVESDNYWQWNSNNRLNFGANVTSNSATSDNYFGVKNLNRVSVLIGNKSTFFKRKLNTSIALRAEYFSAGTLPLTGNISSEYKLNTNIKLLLNAAKVYRQPTLNELFWLPGGNIKLKAEQGYTYEGSINYQRTFNSLAFYINGAAFSRLLNNWMLWLPGFKGNPTPVNIQQVWSRGTETSWKISYKKDKFKWALGVITSYVLSTVQSNEQENNNTVGKQLIYTPRYAVNSNILLGYDHLFFTFFNSYVGYRFTSSDNLEWLNPYQVSSLKVNYTLESKRLNLVLFSGCNNLFNTNYSVVAGRPMPLRNYELGITIQSKQKNK